MNIKSLHDFFRKISESLPSELDMSETLGIFKHSSGNPLHFGEGALENNEFVYTLTDIGKISRFPPDWLIGETLKEIGPNLVNMIRDIKVKFRIDGREAVVENIECVNINDESPEDLPRLPGDPPYLVIITLAETGKKSSRELSSDTRPSTPKKITDALSKFGKLDGVPQTWLTPNDEPVVPNFVSKKGNFIHVHMIKLDELAFDERHDAAELAHLMSVCKNPDLELVFDFDGEHYEIESFKRLAGKGVVVQLRQWGEVYESYGGTIRKWKNLIDEAEEKGVWISPENEDIAGQAEQFKDILDTED